MRILERPKEVCQQCPIGRNIVTCQGGGVLSENQPTKLHVNHNIPETTQRGVRINMKTSLAWHATISTVMIFDVGFIVINQNKLIAIWNMGHYGHVENILKQSLHLALKCCLPDCTSP